MGKDKLRRYAEIADLPTAFDKFNEKKGKWNAEYFLNNNNLILELGCGRGEYTIEQAKFFPEKNFIGIDVKGARLWRGSKTAFEDNMKNAAFLRIQIESIEEHFDNEEVDEIWITFPDPQPQISRAKKRLTHPRFLNHYRNILKSSGSINLKTDNHDLYLYTLEVIQDEKLNLIRHTDNLYQSDLLDDVLNIKTTYEKRYLKEGKKINYIQFSF